MIKINDNFSDFVLKYNPKIHLTSLFLIFFS